MLCVEPLPLGTKFLISLGQLFGFCFNWPIRMRQPVGGGVVKAHGGQLSIPPLTATCILIGLLLCKGSYEKDVKSRHKLIKKKLYLSGMTCSTVIHGCTSCKNNSIKNNSGQRGQL